MEGEEIKNCKLLLCPPSALAYEEKASMVSCESCEVWHMGLPIRASTWIYPCHKGELYMIISNDHNSYDLGTHSLDGAAHGP